MENLRTLVGDEQRLNVLMSALPGSRTLNPIQWDSAIEFWKLRIANYCRLKKKACFTTSELFECFQVDDKKPWCLPEVVSELTRLTVFADYQTMMSKFSWRSWAAKRLIWTPLGIISSSIRTYLPTQSNSSNVGKLQLPESLMAQEIFIPSLIDEFSQSLAPKNHGCDTFDCVFTAEEFISKYLTTIECNQTQHFILETWKSRGVVKYGVIQGQEIFKFGDVPVNEHDLNILQIKRNIQTFEERIAVREKDHDSLMDKVRNSLQSNNKTEAKRVLRQAKVLRDEIDKLKIAVERLHDAKATIDTAALNAQYIGAVKSGSEALKSFASPEKVAEVHEAMENIEEQTALAKEISSALSTPSSPLSDMADLEAELAGLILSGEAEQKAAKAPRRAQAELLDLPATPTSVPKKVPEQVSIQKIATPS